MRSQWCRGPVRLPLYMRSQQTMVLNSTVKPPHVMSLISSNYGAQDRDGAPKEKPFAKWLSIWFKWTEPHCLKKRNCQIWIIKCELCVFKNGMLMDRTTSQCEHRSAHAATATWDCCNDCWLFCVLAFKIVITNFFTSEAPALLE